MAGRGTATKLKTVGDYIDDPHVTCLDTFSLNPVPVSHAPGPLEAFCQIPSDNPERDGPETITLAPGLDVVDFYGSSAKTEVWKNDACFSCLVPDCLQGWEFFTLLHPKPDGSVPVIMNPDSSGEGIELLFGRPPGALQCPSMLFIVVPAGQQYQVSQAAPHQATLRQRPPGRARGKSAATPSSYEKANGNLDAKGQSIAPRLLALCPTTIYEDAAVLPEGSGWGLFVGPRHRRLLLLNKTKGRIDVHMLMLFSMDACFHRGRALINATSRLYRPFGTEEQVVALFSSDYDPLKAHCGLTNAVIADHINSNVDGRGDYQRLLGVMPHSFFVSNSSDNLRFLTPLEVQQYRIGKDDTPELPTPSKLEDFPQWVVGPGTFEADHRTALRKYRTRVIPRTNPNIQNESWNGGVLQLFGLHTTGAQQDSWSHMMEKLGGCAEVTFAGSKPWQEPGPGVNTGGFIDARPAASRPPGDSSEKAESTATALSRVGDKAPEPIVHWRHSLDLIPGSDVVAKAPPERQAEAQSAPRSAFMDDPPALLDGKMSDAMAATMQPLP